MRNAVAITMLGPGGDHLDVNAGGLLKRSQTACHKPVSVMPPITAQRTVGCSADADLIAAGSAAGAAAHSRQAGSRAVKRQPTPCRLHFDRQFRDLGDWVRVQAAACESTNQLAGVTCRIAGQLGQSSSGSCANGAWPEAPHSRRIVFRRAPAKQRS